MTRAQFEQEVRINQEPLRRFLLNLCSGNSALSDDIAQEAFIKAYMNIGSFAGMSKFSTWLFRIAYKCFCDHKRKTERFDSVEISNTLHYSMDDTDGRFKNQELYMALGRLGENEKTCILLFYMEDKSIKEIAAITGIKENTVKSHLSRAKANISDYLKHTGYERS